MCSEFHLIKSCFTNVLISLTEYAWGVKSSSCRKHESVFILDVLCCLAEVLNIHLLFRSINLIEVLKNLFTDYRKLNYRKFKMRFLKTSKLKRIIGKLTILHKLQRNNRQDLFKNNCRLV